MNHTDFTLLVPEETPLSSISVSFLGNNSIHMLLEDLYFIHLHTLNVTTVYMHSFLCVNKSMAMITILENMYLLLNALTGTLWSLSVDLSAHSDASQRLFKIHHPISQHVTIISLICIANEIKFTERK